MYSDDIDTALDDLVVDNALHAEDVVAAARDPLSPLHSKFQWDDSKAAHRYRLWQARQIIASERSSCLMVEPRESTST